METAPARQSLGRGPEAQMLGLPLRGPSHLKVTPTRSGELLKMHCNSIIEWNVDVEFLIIRSYSTA